MLRFFFPGKRHSFFRRHRYAPHLSPDPILTLLSARLQAAPILQVFGGAETLFGARTRAHWRPKHPHGHREVALDFQFSRHGTTPIADRLASFTQVRGLVFGQYAEASLDVHALIDLAAHALARKHWRSSGARNEAEARSWWVSICRRRIGVAVARAYARYRIRRMVFIGVPRAVLDDRARRGVAGVAGGADGGHRADVDLRDFYRYQVHVRANAD